MALELPAGIEIVVAALVGAIIGSFLNVCILRWGAEPKQSVVRPPSRCPRCGSSLSWYDNIPVLSWLLLRARCRGCGEPISVQYPLIELATAGIWAFMAWRHGLSLEALRGAVFGTILLGIAMTDAREYIIPHEFSIGGTVLAVMMSAWPDPMGAISAVEGALIGAGSVLLIGELSGLALGQEAMGGGDCALMGLIGAFLGWEAIVPVLLVGATVSTVLSLVATAWPRREPMPVGRAEPRSFRWRMVARLFLLGAIPMLAIAVSIQFGAAGEVLDSVFYALLGAGLAYYASFLLPESVAQQPWVRVRGLIAAAAGIALSDGLFSPRLIVGLVLGLLVFWYARQIRLAETPETTEGLKVHGYLPFGVGLAIAAGLLEFSGTFPLVKEMVTEYGRLLRLG